MRLTLNILILLISNLCFGASFKNEVFKSNIKTVRLESTNSKYELPIIHLNSQEQILLSFDDLTNNAKEYTFTFVKCDANWNPSEDLFFHDYIEGMQTGYITDFHFSENTATNFIHYSLEFPNDDYKFLISGNYIVLVKDSEDESIVFTQKFYITDQKVQINPQPRIPVEFDHRYTHHIINFNVDHSLLPSSNPMNEFRAVVIQNNRYDNAKKDLKPLFVKHNELVFSNEKQNLFEAGNEYRTLDFRDVKLTGMGVDRIFYQDSIYHIIPTIDYKRAYLKYKNISDYNGKYFIQIKPKTGDPDLTSDYAYVHFRLSRKIPLDSSTVYLTGNITNGEINRDFKMLYKDSLEHYEAHVLMKQGVYNYAYVARKIGNSELTWEDTDGTHYETENSYTILLYYKGFNDLTETLIGVKRFVFQ